LVQLMHKTLVPRVEEVPRRWLLVDAQNKVLGRLASQVAKLLIGKTKPQYTRHLLIGDNVIAINVDKIRVTGKKLDQKEYFHYTGYPGGLKSETLGKRLANKPDKVFRDAVYGMLPKNRLGRRMLAHLHVYSGTQHTHQAQKPEPYRMA